MSLHPVWVPVYYGGEARKAQAPPSPRGRGCDRSFPARGSVLPLHKVERALGKPGEGIGCLSEQVARPVPSGR